jgi:hypothetical protein
MKNGIAAEEFTKEHKKHPIQNRAPLVRLLFYQKMNKKKT